MSKVIGGLVVVALVGVGAFFLLSRPAKAPVIEQETQEKPAVTTGTSVSNSDADGDMDEMDTAAAGTVSATVKEQNGSKESGTVTFSEQAGKVKVTLALQGVPAGASQPAHIHTGSCAKLGSPIYPLSNVGADGKSETILNMKLEDLWKQAPFAVNAHKSAAEIGKYVACADVQGPGGTSQKTTTTQQAGEVKTFNVSGKNFSFSPAEIRVKKGEKVTINFTSESGFHDWVVDEFNAHTDRVSTGGKTSVTFTADKAGTFEYYCSVGSHRQMGMKGNLIVQ